MLNYVYLKRTIVIMSVLIGYLTLIVEQSSINKFSTIVIIFLLFALLYINLKLKFSIEKVVSESEEQYRNLVEIAPLGIIVYQNGKIVYGNSIAVNLIGAGTYDNLIGRLELDLIHPDEKLKELERISRILKGDKVSFVEKKMITIDGNTIIVEASSILVKHKNGLGVMCLFKDITERKKSEEKLREAENKMKKIAYYDVLTGLPNRYMLNNFINDFIVDVNDKKHNCAVMFTDLDNFKNINDSFGHSIGDFVLLQTAEKLKNCVRKGDMVFRYDSDEFIIILRDIQRKDIILIAETIIKEFKNPFILNEHEIFNSLSIGISFYPTDSRNMKTIIKDADAAMYSVKKMGKNNYKLFSKEIDKAIHRKVELEKGLRKALENNEFSLYYQPQIDLDTGETWGLEALIRWQHPTLGIISPAEFIPLAEETGLIIPIGEWVLESACRQNKLWQEEGLMNIPVAVNVSAVQLNNSNFVETVKGYLQSTKLNPQYLVIELTESIMQDTSKSVKILRDLKSLGVKVAIDDFGTGYSSLSLLKDLPIDILKIDSYFIKDVVENSNTLFIIKLIIDMGRKLNFSIIVEGIETEQQARIVKRNGCKVVQGYLFSVPLPAEKIKQYLENIEVSLCK